MIVKAGKYKVELWDDLKDIPAGRLQEFNVAVLIDAEIGGDLSAIDGHIEKLLRLVKTGDQEKLTNEVMAMRQSIYFVVQKVSPRHQAFVSLIKSIDGKPVDTVSQEKVRAIIDKLSGEGMTETRIKEVVEEVKKKFRGVLSYFSRKSLHRQWI
jgi:hypothetical protein